MKPDPDRPIFTIADPVDAVRYVPVDQRRAVNLAGANTRKVELFRLDQERGRRVVVVLRRPSRAPVRLFHADHTLVTRHSRFHRLHRRLLRLYEDAEQYGLTLGAFDYSPADE